MFDLASIQVEDKADMAVLDPRTNEPTDWTITFAGPTHARSVKHRNETWRKGLRDMRKPQRQRDAEDSEDEMAEGVVKLLLARTLGWKGVTHNGEPFEYSEENARKVYRSNPIIREQALTFINDNNNFLQESASS